MIKRRRRSYIAACFIATLALLVGASSKAFAEDSATAAQPLPGTSPEVMRFIERATSTGQGFSGRLYFAKLIALRSFLPHCNG